MFYVLIYLYTDLLAPPRRTSVPAAAMPVGGGASAGLGGDPTAAFARFHPVCICYLLVSFLPCLHLSRRTNILCRNVCLGRMV